MSELRAFIGVPESLAAGRCVTDGEAAEALNGFHELDFQRPLKAEYDSFELFEVAKVAHKEVRLSALALARQACSSCDVRLECADYGVENYDRGGLWGGLTTPQRKKRAQKLNIASKQRYRIRDEGQVFRKRPTAAL
jgi:hypothetical protein